MNHFLPQPSSCIASPERLPAATRPWEILSIASCLMLYAAGAAAQTPAQNPAQTPAASAVTPGITLSVTSATLPVSTIASGSTITLTASVPVAGKNLLTGIVRFCDAAVAPHCTHENKLANAQLTKLGTATYKFTPGPGAHSYTAVFLPQWHFNTVSSAAATLNVTTPGTSVTTLAQSGIVGAYTLAAKVAVTGPAGVLPTGSVQFVDTSANNLVLSSVPLVAAASGFGFSSFTLPTGVVSGSSSVTVGDFNRDGKQDMAVVGSDSTSVQILLGNGDGTFTQGAVVGNFYAGIRQIKSADFNQDGIADLAVVDGTNNVIHIFLGNGDGTFTQAPDALTMNGAYGITITDFNKDGIPDMIVANAYSDTVAFLKGKGDGTFTSGWDSYVTWQNPTNVLSGDFNNDGNQDFAVNILNGAGIAIFLGNGDGTFAAPVFYTVGNHPAYMAAGDFTGDGSIDLAVANSGDNTITILAGKGDGTFTVKSTFAAPVGITDIAAANFNQDGKVDLVVSTSTGNSLAYFLGNGDGTFTASSVVPAGNGPYQIALGDFNADGVVDVATADTGNAATAVLTKLSQGSTATLPNLSIPGNGTHLVVAKYLGDTNFGTSTSAPQSLLAKTLATNTALYTSAFSVSYGKQLSLTANVSPFNAGSSANATSNGELVTFYCDGKVIGMAPLNSGSATFNTTSLPVGVHLVGVVYNGDSILLPSLGLNLVNVTSATGFGWFF